MIILLFLPSFLINLSDRREFKQNEYPKSSRTSSEILRPDANIQNQWEVSDFSRIVDEGNGANSHSGNYEFVVDIFNMGDIQTTEKYEATTITIHLFCKCRVSVAGSAKIEVKYRLGLEGTWSSIQTVRSPFGKAWISFSWPLSGIYNLGLDDLQVALSGSINANKFGGYVQVDVMYADIEYQTVGIDVISPHEGIYNSPMTGYYPATYGFESDDSGSVPNEWDDFSSGNAYAHVVGSAYGHQKVIRLSDPFQWGACPSAGVRNSFEYKNKGTIEFWFLTTNIANTHYLILRHDTVDIIKVRFFRLYPSVSMVFQYWSNGQWVEIMGDPPKFPLDNFEWYHFQINFDSSCSKWNLNIDGDSTMRIEYSSPGGGDANSFVVSTDAVSHSYDVYIDAVGYSWDPYYDLLDNKYPGILLDFSPDDLEYMSYTFNNVTRQIYGDTVLPMPKSGVYSFSVYGLDQDGYEYYSEECSFSVDYAEKIMLIFYASDSGNNWGDYSIIEYAEQNNQEYIGILQNEGYTKFYTYRDVSNLEEFDTIMNTFAIKRVDYQDEIFIYMYTHGERFYDYDINAWTSLAYIRHNGGSGDVTELPALHFREKMNYLYYQSGTNKIGFMIDACFSGYFVDAFNSPDSYPFLAISSTDFMNVAGGYKSIIDPQCGKGYFSNHFFYAVSNGYGAAGAYYFAIPLTHADDDFISPNIPHQNPLINDDEFHAYSFFL